MHADADKQGLVQGMITGVRGLCNGLGPAMFGLIFSLFHVDLNEEVDGDSGKDLHFRSPTHGLDTVNQTLVTDSHDPIGAHIIPGPPFVFGALLVILALLVAAIIPDHIGPSSGQSNTNSGSMLSAGGGSSGRRLHHQYHHDDSRKKSDDDLSDMEYTVPLMEKGNLL